MNSLIFIHHTPAYTLSLTQPEPSEAPALLKGSHNTNCYRWLTQLWKATF